LSGVQLDPAVKTEREQKLMADVDKLTTKTAKQLLELNKPLDCADFASTAGEWLPLYEWLEKLERAAQCAFERVLEQLEHHRQGLGVLLRKANQIIEGEFEEVPSPSFPDSAPSPASSRAPAEPTASHSSAAGLNEAVRNEGATVANASPLSLPVCATVPPGEHSSMEELPGGSHAHRAGGLEAEARGGPAVSGELSPSMVALQRALGLHSSTPMPSLEELVGALPPIDAGHKRK
jgi:hypothetical protein